MEPRGLKTGFPALLNVETRVLVLGSLPSDESIKQQRYYAKPQNQFWPIMYAVLDAGTPAPQYADRVGLLLSRGIGLWDVLHSAEREGSSDSKIRNPVQTIFGACLSGIRSLNESCSMAPWLSHTSRDTTVVATSKPFTFHHQAPCPGSTSWLWNERSRNGVRRFASARPFNMSFHRIRSALR